MNCVWVCVDGEQKKVWGEKEAKLILKTYWHTIAIVPLSRILMQYLPLLECCCHKIEYVFVYLAISFHRTNIDAKQSRRRVYTLRVCVRIRISFKR